MLIEDCIGRFPTEELKLSGRLTMRRKYGIENILVEQDNAPALGDVFAQMKTSFEHLNPIIHI